MWTVINRLANATFAAWLWPLQHLPATLQIGATAIPVAIFALLVFKYASNQHGITAAKNRIKAYLLELWLYKDYPRVLLHAQGQVVTSSLTYLGYSLAPLAVMIIPVALLIIQLESRFAFRALKPGEATILTVSLGAAGVDAPDATLSATPGIVIETPPLRLDGQAQVLWRVRAKAPGTHRIRIKTGAAEATLRLIVGTQEVALGPAVYRATDWRVLGYPAEPALAPDCPVVAATIGYPRARAEFLGLSSASWILLGTSMLLGYALRGAFGVTF